MQTPDATLPPIAQAVPAAAASQTEVFAVHGADPEVLAYAMAKYSRSALSMKESLREISAQRAEQFLNTFYFAYGHRSIADLAHVAFAIEKLSLLAAISLVDEQRWDGQERSTRYQNFKKSGWFTPAFADDDASAAAYGEAIEALFAAYNSIGESMFHALKRHVAKPAELDQAAYDRTLKARAFDVARYLLPLATNTSLGQIVNARTLETQVSRLLSSEFEEIRGLGERLRAAAATPAWNVNHDSLRSLQREVAAIDPILGAEAERVLLREVKAAPTLVKYAAANEYEIATRKELAQAATELMHGQPIDPAPVVDLIEDDALEVELATSLLYPNTHYSYRQLRRTVEALPAARRDEIVALGAKHRGPHDELLRPFSSGHGLRFDLLMDIGAFRDMHRHRRCVQLIQPWTTAHGYEIPDCPGQPTLADAGLLGSYQTAMDAAFAAHDALAASSPSDAAYVLPLGTRCRSLFKMDFAEALYICEIRSTPAGHFSYRRVAWEMFQAVARAHPSLASYFRIQDVNEPVDLLKR